jgi:urease beta subunit
MDPTHRAWLSDLGGKMVDEILKEEREVPAASEEGTLEDQKKRLEAMIAAKKLADKAIQVELHIIAALINHGYKFDRKSLNFLEQLHRGGQDAQTYLAGMVAQLQEKPLDQERKIKRLKQNLKTVVEALDILLTRPDLKPLADLELLQEINDKSSALLSG